MRILYFLLFILIVSCTKTKESNVSKPNKEDNSYYEKAWLYLDQKEPVNAFENFNKAKEIYLKNNDSLGVGKCLMNMGIILADQGDYFGAQETSLEAEKFFNKNKREQFSYISSNYNNLGIVGNRLKDYNTTLEFYDLAIKYSDNKLDSLIYLKNKGNSFKENKNYSQAIKLYQDILPDVKKNNNITRCAL